MTHLPFIAASYALCLGGFGALGILAAVRLRGATRRLRAVDPRGGGGGARDPARDRKRP